MARRGRKAKVGKRYENGRLIQTNYPEPVYDKGSAWVQERRGRFGEHYSSALGRAYASGLLGEGEIGKLRLDAAKRFVRVYQRFMGADSYRCPLDDTPRGGNVVSLEVSDHQRSDHAWLVAAMDSMDVAGVRPYFDQLVSSLHVDHGPYWIDALIAGKRHPADIAVLNAAIRALDIITPEQRPMGIRSVAC